MFKHELFSLTYYPMGDPRRAWVARCNCGTNMKARRSQAYAIESLVQHIGDVSGASVPFNDFMYDVIMSKVRKARF